MRRVVTVTDDRTTIIAFLTLTVLASFAEALAIILLAAGAANLASGSQNVAVAVGGIQVTASYAQWFAAGIVGAVAMLVARLGTATLSSRLSSQLLTRSRNRLVGALLYAAWDKQSQMTASRFQDLVSIQSLRMAHAISVLAQFASSTISFAAMVLAAFFASPVTALALLVVGAVLAIAFRPLSRWVQRSATAHVTRHHQYVDSVADVLGVLTETRIHGVQESVRLQQEADAADAASTFRTAQLVASLQPRLYLGVVMVLLFGGVMVLRIQGELDLALIGAIVLILLRGLRYSQSAQAGWQRVVELLPYVADFDRVIADLSADGPPRGSKQLGGIESLKLEDVHYVYPGGHTALHGVTVSVNRGEVVGLAGPSGAGKSTLAHVLLGLLRPSSGTMLVNGDDSAAFTAESWFSRLAFVPQQSVLVRGDVIHNVRFFREHVSDEDVAWALRAAAMERDLELWAQGERREVGPGGSAVSGGQRQRIAIARALAGRPDLLVLDEPTSALDPDAETAIREAIGRLRGEVAVVLIAHRDSTLAACDRIVRLSDGKVADADE